MKKIEEYRGPAFLGPHGVLHETRMLLLDRLECTGKLTSDHYTKYIDLEGELPAEGARALLSPPMPCF